jgi:hypothetical protein
MSPSRGSVPRHTADWPTWSAIDYYSFGKADLGYTLVSAGSSPTLQDSVLKGTFCLHSLEFYPNLVC